MSLFGNDDNRLLFGADTRPVAQGITRRHPMAIGLYAVVMLLGAIFVFHLYAPNRNEAQLFPGVNHWITFTWKWSMLLGGLGAITAIWLTPRVQPHYPDLVDLLHLEAIFAIVSTFGLLVYIYVVVRLEGVSQSYQAIGVYAAMVIAHAARAYQCSKDAKRLEALYAHATREVLGDGRSE